MLQMIRNRLKDQRGLTLIELLAVIVILGIVAAIAVPSILGIIQNSKVDSVKSEAIQVINAGKLYVASEGIPDGNTIDASQITPYLDGVDSDELDIENLKVTDDNVISINATGTIDSITINFNNATLDQINDAAKPNNNVLTIGDAEPTTSESTQE